MLYGCTVPPDSKDIEFGGSNQEASSSAGKNTGLVLVPQCAWKYLPTTDEFSVRLTKITSRVGVS